VAVLKTIPKLDAAPAADIVISRVARTDPSLADLQRLRYDVYCLEREFINPNRFPDRRERDDYDEVAFHFTASMQGSLAGTVRLVPDSKLGFPMERFAPHGLIESAGLPRERTAEISRLVLARQYRRSATPPGTRLLSELFQHGFAQGNTLGFDTLIAALEPTLLRLLTRFGYVLEPIGAPFDWYGPVTPCAVTGLPANVDRARRSAAEIPFVRYVVPGKPLIPAARDF
jgi:N-acyl-L-homoserine lactone synthetase